DRNKGQDRDYRQKGAGSGVIISTDGYIITNNHVVGDADEVDVTLGDRRKFKAEIVGTDPLTDIALIKIKDVSNLQPIAIGTSKNLQIGELVMAIGNPLNIGTTVTSGIISALNRSINIIQEDYGIEKFIQTDAAINPGNSGGALVNLRGELIGINTAIASYTGYYSGYGFAVPVDIVKFVIAQLKETGKVKRGYIGIRLQPVDYTIAKSNGWEVPKGVYVSQVFENRPGAQAGLHQDDIILSVDGVEVNQPQELQAEVSSKPFDAYITLAIFREGKYLTKRLQLQEPDDSESPNQFTSNTSATAKLGITVKDLGSAIKRSLKVDRGVEVVNVRAYSEAAENGLRPGDVILKAGNTEIDTKRDFDNYLADKRSGNVVKLFVQPADGSFKRHIYLEVE
ncbi:MAG: Do family serine endopeptidase, partial [Calditrichaeota bacterium]|nr:Do family serine endopeptidase [Calditrichota bacterium]